MAISNNLVGTIVDLIPVSVADAGFTMDIRNDEKLTEFIPKIETTLEKQQNWLKFQRDKIGDYFYVITRKNGEQIGTAAIYDVDCENDICEYGRYISYGNAFENVETAILSLEFAFYTLGIGCIMFNNDVKNKKIISFWKRFGASFDAEYDYGSWTAARYLMTREDYERKSEKIKKLLQGDKALN